MLYHGYVMGGCEKMHTRERGHITEPGHRRPTPPASSLIWPPRPRPPRCRPSREAGSSLRSQRGSMVLWEKDTHRPSLGSEPASAT